MLSFPRSPRYVGSRVCNIHRESSSKIIKQVPVCILGGGPVGLLLSSQLSSYGINHCIVERRETPTKHPQAHFMNARTMEILQAHLPKTFNSVVHEMPPSETWRDFVYCHSVTGRHFARVDQFEETDPVFWDESPTNVVHLPQNKFENILRKEVLQNESTAELLFGYEAKDIISSLNGTRVLLKRSNYGKAEARGNSKDDDVIELNCVYLLAADGANSLARQSLGIPLVGEECIQTLLNVHFTCYGLRDLLKPRPAMLYFVFNESMVAVFVAHDPLKDEWVCQIPIFPPFRTPVDFDNATVLKVLRKGLGLTNSQQELDIKILTVNSWVMHAQVAKNFTNSDENIMLAGDAAHRFPPAGGFGMNTGLQDAHNIAWKIAMVLSKRADKALLSTYEEERKPVAESNTRLSMINYEKSASVARVLGVDPVLAKIAIDAAKASSYILPLPLRKLAINTILDTGLSTLALLAKPGYALGDVRINLLQRIMDKKQSLPLVFPSQDIDFAYAKDDGKTGKENDIKFSRPLLRVGGRIPHCWFSVNNSAVSNNVDSLEKEGMSTVSSVLLPGLLHCRSTTTSAILTDDNRSSLIPKEVVESVGNNAFQVVGIRSYAKISSNLQSINDKIQQNHRQVQSAEQRPSSDDIKRKESYPIIKSDLIPTTQLITQVAGIDMKQNVTLYDLTGRWMETCIKSEGNREYIERRKNLMKEDKFLGYCGVAVRPDGHIAYICPVKDSGSVEYVTKHIKAMKAKLYIF